jgi:hypothetical protein
MSGVSLPVTRPTGRAIVVGQPSCRTAPTRALERMGFACTGSDDPYDAMSELTRRPLFYSAVIICLHSVYKEELQIISSLKRRYTHVEVWLADTDGRQGALVEAMQLGADGLVDEEGLHRLPVAKITPPPRDEPPVPRPEPVPPERQVSPAHLPMETKEIVSMPEIAAGGAPGPSGMGGNDPVLTAEELRALLQESHNPPAN